MGYAQATCDVMSMEAAGTKSDTKKAARIAEWARKETLGTMECGLSDKFSDAWERDDMIQYEIIRYDTSIMHDNFKINVRTI